MDKISFVGNKRCSSSPLWSLLTIYILEDDFEEITVLTPKDNEELKEEKQKKRKEDNFLCKDTFSMPIQILSAMSTGPVHRPNNFGWAWRQYKIEEACIEVSIIFNFMDFKMSNDKLVVTQIPKCLHLGLTTIKRLKHDDRKYYLESLQWHLRIQKYFRNRHRNDYSDVKTKVNVIDIDKNIEKNKLEANNDKMFKKNGSNPKY
jgi:hypothetical protein